MDDPFTFGQIVVTNCLSDVYAMGGRPISALNFVAYPKPLMKINELAKILQGAMEKAKEADCPIIGGHSMTDTELKYGLCVTGVIHPDKVIKNSTAKIGDKLILTKPLGSGILSRALQMGDIEEDLLRKVTAVMTELNRIPSELMVEYGASAATDITGFGLLGHTYEMASGSKVGITIYADSVPFIEGIIKKVEEGYVPPLTFENQLFLEKYIYFSEKITDEMRTILYDSQTSGGLIISINPERAETLLKALHDRGVKNAAIIGEITEKQDKSLRVI